MPAKAAVKREGISWNIEAPVGKPPLTLTIPITSSRQRRRAPTLIGIRGNPDRLHSGTPINVTETCPENAQLSHL